MKRFCYIFSLAVWLATESYPQSVTGTIAGAAKDESGAIMPVVKVTVTNTDTGLTRSVLTDAHGEYVVTLLPVGTYQATAELPGFSTQVRQGITLQVDQRLTLDFALKVGTVDEKVLVTATEPLVQSETSSVGTVVENRRVVELPLNGRQFRDLALLVPGVNPPAPGSIEIAYGTIVVAGAREESTTFTLDGVDMQDNLVSIPSFKPSIDAVEEFKLQTSNYAAEFGRSAGGKVVVTTKSGTNQFHGTLFDFLRNSQLDAKNFFDIPTAKIPGFKRNDFGGTLGGPIKRNQTFFFVNYEGLRLRQAETRTATVPTAAMQQGNFAGIGKAIIDPLSGQPFPGGVIPSNRINPVGANIANLYPLPDLTGSAGNYVSTPEDQHGVDQFTVKVDHRFSAKDNFFARYSYNNDTELDPFDVYSGITNLPGYGRWDYQRGHNAALSNTYVFSPTLLLETRLGYNRYYELRTAQTRSNLAQQLGIPGTTTAAFDLGPPAIMITGFDSLGKKASFPSDRGDNTYEAVGDMTYVRNGHTFKVGGEVSRFNSNNLNNGGLQGSFTFTGQYTGNALADVLLGDPKQTSRTIGDTENPIYRNGYALYLQDDWRIIPRLTLNLGVRYDLMSSVVSASNRLSSFNFSTGAIDIAGEPSVRQDIARPDYPGGANYNSSIAALIATIPIDYVGSRNIYKAPHDNVAPRVGLAYRLLGNDRLVLRSGYGIYYDMAYLNIVALGPARNFPFKVAQTFNASASTPNIAIDNPFPTALAGATVSPTSIDPNFKTGNVQQFNFGLQSQLASDLFVDLAYVGNVSHHLYETINLNQAYPSSVGTVASRQPYPSLGTVNLTEPGGDANFSSLQLRVEKRYGQTLTLVANYTYSKSIDVSSGQSGASDDNNTAQNNHAFAESMRGLSSFDVRQRLVFSYVYELPFGSGRRFLPHLGGFANTLVGGWELSGIAQAQSGRPITVDIGADISNTGNIPNDRPNLIGNPVLPAGQRTPNHWFNKAAFALPTFGTFGDVGRNTLIGPPFSEIDFSVIKNTRIGERKTVQFRAEIFNLLNHPNFDQPNRDANSSQFTEIFSAEPSRQIQLGLKFTF